MIVYNTAECKNILDTTIYSNILIIALEIEGEL